MSKIIPIITLALLISPISFSGIAITLFLLIFAYLSFSGNTETGTIDRNTKFMTIMFLCFFSYIFICRWCVSSKIQTLASQLFINTKLLLGCIGFMLSALSYRRLSQIVGAINQSINQSINPMQAVTLTSASC